MGNKGAEWQFLQFAEENRHPKPECLWQSEASEAKPILAVHYPGSGPVQTPTAHTAPRTTSCDREGFLKPLPFSLCKCHQCKVELHFAFKPVKLH